MDDILSQGEIDALMSGLNDEMEKAADAPDADSSAEEVTSDEAESGKVKGERQIKKYDFKRPERFSRDQLRMLEMMHESFARHFGTALSAFIRTIAEVEVVSVKQASYAEYISKIPNPTALTVFSFDPLRGNCLLEINPGIIFPIIDRVLGGPGNPIAKERELTDIEQVVVGKLAIKALDTLKDSWSRVIEVTPEIINKETNPQFVQVVAPSEMCLFMKFNLKIREYKGSMSICFPYLVLESVIPKLSTQTWFTSDEAAKSEEQVANLRQKLANTRVPVSVQVGKTLLTTKQVLDLKKGDVIQLGASVDTQMEVFVENRKKFGGRPGIHSKKKAVMITTVYQDMDED
jgi:flagellar motor switch protein FliM